jgi:serine/threonine protein kinase
VSLKNQNPYWTAGTLEGKAYIERDADQRLRKELSDNQRFVFLFGPRHSGTSSLVTHCMDSLSPGQYCCTRVDLSKLPQSDYHTLIGALLETIANDTALDKQEILTEFPEDTILAWLRTFPQRLILFLDEVQALAKLPFRDQLFGKLRFLYNVRVENEQFSRVQVVLSGAAHPERLIPINLAIPFVGGGISVPLLSQKQVEKLTWDLETAGVQIDGQVASLLYTQTSGIVHLCQIILSQLWEEANKSKVNVGVADVERIIDRLVGISENIPHFATIYGSIAEESARVGAFLRLVKGDPIDPGMLHDLVLTGLCDPERPYLCPIYERVFGPGGPLDLALLQKVHTQVTSKHAIISLPSQATPEVHTEPPPEARREHSLVARLPLPPSPAQSSATPPIDVLQIEAPPPDVLQIEAPPPDALSIEALPPDAPPLEALPEPPLVPLSPRPLPGMSADALPAPPAPLSPPLPPSRITPLVQEAIEPPPIELRSAELQPVDLGTLSEPSSPAESSSEEILEIEQEEDPTWVDDPVKEMKNQLARQNVEKEAPSSDKKIVEVRGKLEAKLMLSAELDSFCASFFPHVQQKFVPGMSRSEKTELLLSLVAANEISKRLREWSSRIELNQEVISQVSRVMPPAGTAESGPTGRSGKSPRAAEPLPVEDSAQFKPPGTMQVGVGLVLANRYFLTSEVGHGPVTVVWNAYDRIKDEQVALKLLNGSLAEKPAVLEVFWRSAQQMAALSHPAIVGVLNKPREENEIHYVVLEFLPGGNLRQWVQAGKLSKGQILRVLSRLGAGLQYAHERRVLHRNIKPSNILFDSTGHARLSDFNLVWPGEVAASSEARSDRLMYMAPEEQLGGGSGDPRSDVYSLGMCALYALYGKDLPNILVQDRTSFIDRLDCNASLKAVLKRATAASPFDRFATAAEFCRALEFDGPSLPGVSLRNSMPLPVVAARPEREPTELQAALPQESRRPAPSLPVTPPTSPPPPIPNAPQSAAPPPLPVAQVVSVSPPPLPVFAPQELVVPETQPTYESRRREPDSGEIPPMPGRNPATQSEYRIETERLRALAAAAAANPQMPDATPIVPPNRPMRWQSYAFVGIAMLAVAGAGIGYLVGEQKGKPTTGESGTGPVAMTGNGPPPISQPLRVESLLPPSANPPPTAAPTGDAPPARPTVDDKALAKVTPEKDVTGSKPAMPPPNPALVAMNPVQKPAEKPGEKAAEKIAQLPTIPPPEKANQYPPVETHEKPLVVAQAPLQPVAKPELKVEKPVPAKEPPPALVAQKPVLAGKSPEKLAAKVPEKLPEKLAAKVPEKLAAKPAEKPAVKVEQKPAEKPVLIALAPKSKTKVVSDVAAPPTQPKVSETPRTAPRQPTKVAVAQKKAAPPPRPVPPPPPVRPTPTVTRPAPSAASTPEGEAALSLAQQAFVRGQHQQAISMAMGITQRGGGDALKAWRFVGSAACSVKSVGLATNAYNHLKDPDHKRLLLELCRRNGLNWNGSSFSSSDD